MIRPGDEAKALEALQARHRKPKKSVKYPYRLVPFDELRPGTKSNYLVDGVIPRAGLVAVWGPPKCGKSFWVFDLVLHIALRWSYRARRVNGGPVCYMAFEGAEGFKARAEAFRRTHEITGKVPLFLIASNAKLARDHPALIASINGQMDAPPVVVVLDTLNRSIDGSESKDADMGAYLAAAETIHQEFDCAVLIVHHCGVDGTRPRGHTSLSGAVDAQIAVKRDGANNIIAEVEAMKDAAEGARFASALKVVDVGLDDEGQPMTSCIIVPVEGAAEPQKAKVRLADNYKLALDALQKALADAGERPPASNHIPQGGQVRCVPLDLWRRYFYAVFSGEGDTPKKTFKRARERLQALKIIGVWNDTVWLGGQGDTWGTGGGHAPRGTEGGRHVSPLKGETRCPPACPPTAVPAFRVIGSTPAGTLCIACQGTDGAVMKIRSAEPGSKSETLHIHCAERWFSELHREPRRSEP